LFLGVPYDAVASDENRSGEPPEEPEGPEASGFEALLYSLADALQTKQSKEAIALLIRTTPMMSAPAGGASPG